MSQCQTCQKELSGKQTKYCSVVCKNVNSNAKYQNYQKQQERGLQRKLKLVRMLGGKCICGYNRNVHVLQFHHIEPNNKSFSLTIRECSNHSWNKLVAEAKKCQLLCANCHSEFHWPNGSARI